LIFIITPIIINMSFRARAADGQVILYLSPHCEELLGKEMTEKLISEFEGKNPGIRIIPANDAFEPDILIFDDGHFSALAAADALLELNSFTNYDSGSRQMAIPLVSFMDLLFYNINILSAAGLDRPPKTREEFITHARAVSRGNLGASAAAVSLSPNDRQSLSRDIFSWIWAGGNNFLSENAKPSINTRFIVNDIAFLGTLSREGLFAPDIFTTTGNQRLEEFAQGRVAMMIAPTRVIPYLRQRMGDDAFGITTIPDSGTGGRYSISPSAIYAAISADSRYPDEVWRFLVFLAERSSLICAELKAVPGVVSDIIPGDYVRDDPFYSKAWEIFEFAEITEGFAGKHGALGYKNIFLEEFKIFFESARTAQETVNAIQRRWDTLPD
jgi:multiple sugar transport system substrate-binding protein